MLIKILQASLEIAKKERNAAYSQQNVTFETD